MILPINASASKPVAYAGGQAPTAQPSFGASLQASLAQLQATNHGLTANTTQHHHGHGAGPFQTQSTSSDAANAALTMPAL
jgi:hypothetical protein